MALPQKLVNLLVIIVPLIFFIGAFFLLDWRQKKRAAGKDSRPEMKHPGPRS